MKKDAFLKLVDEIISEIQKEEDELDEITVTGNVDGYNTPNAFKKTDGNNPDDEPDDEYVKRINTGTGFTKVNEGKKRFNQTSNVGKSKYTVSYHDGSKKNKDGSDFFDMKIFKNKKELDAFKKDLLGKGYVSESKQNSLSENRWHQLRKEDATPNKKIGVGIRNIRKQLSEIELFLNWYSKLKTENGLTKETYWRRTNRHLNAIKERLNNISDRISNL